MAKNILIVPNVGSPNSSPSITFENTTIAGLNVLSGATIAFSANSVSNVLSIQPSNLVVSIGDSLNARNYLSVGGIQVIGGTNIWSGSTSGLTGSQGATGNTGGVGAQGPIGAQGNTGAQGAVGTAGDQGNLGAQGNVGPQGLTGTQGGIGPTSAVGPQGGTGTVGGQGSQGTKGGQGAQGPKGGTGPATGPGPTGSQGAQGSGGQGAQGAEGGQGAQGLQGAQGPKGGAQGAQGPIGAVGPASDARLKKDIEVLKDSLEKIMKLDVVEYDWNDKVPIPDFYANLIKNKKTHSIGLIAQNVKKYFPEVIGTNNGYYFINYAKLNAVLVESIKEQDIFIEDIDKELNFIKSKFN